MTLDNGGGPDRGLNLCPESLAEACSGPLFVEQPYGTLSASDVSQGCACIFIFNGRKLQCMNPRFKRNKVFGATFSKDAATCLAAAIAQSSFKLHTSGPIVGAVVIYLEPYRTP